MISPPRNASPDRAPAADGRPHPRAGRAGVRGALRKCCLRGAPLGLLALLAAPSALAAIPSGARRAAVAIRPTTVSGLSGLGGSATRAAQHATSQNWAGYAVTAAAPFTRVLGSWVAPAPSCTSATPSYAAFWIGIGGFTHTARGLEQIGTDSDCGAHGTATLFAWYELLPAPPVQLALKVHAGDRMTASVTVLGHRVALHIRDMSTRKAFITSVHVRRPDTSSAEWIAEAPSSCASNGSCRTLPLANFGAVTFSGALAALGGGPEEPVGAPLFAATNLDLRDQGVGTAASEGGSPPASSGARASTSPLSPEGSSFLVSWEAGPAAASPATG
ncbi:MAG: hypothetical protein KGJ43_03870 [Acidobacteriota bacterium]|nr:hypothetical protein [Acidobacteriota bacterium]